METPWKAKDIIDWARRIHWIYTVVFPLLGATSVGAAMRALLIAHGHVPEIWRLPIYLACATLAIVVFALIGDWLAKQPQTPQDEAREVLEKVMLAGAEFAVYDLMYGRAKELVFQLEELWHLWNNEDERLIHPLTATDVLKNPSTSNARNLIDKRRDFLVLYSNHIVTMKSLIPDFKSRITETGYPSNLPYVETRSALASHAEELLKTSKKAWETYGRPLDSLQ